MTVDLVNKIRAEVAEVLSERLSSGDGSSVSSSVRLADQRALATETVAQALDRHAREVLKGAGVALTDEDEELIERAVLDAVFGLGRLQRLLDDPEIENINANGCDVVWVRYSDGRREQVDAIASSDEELIELIRTAAARFGPSERRFDLGSPRLNLQLPDGSRLFAVMAVTERPSISIRRHRYLKVGLDDLVAMGTMSELVASFLSACVKARQNLIVCGGTGAGKTTLLRALAAEIPRSERLITIEDSLELGLERFDDIHGDVVAMEAREPNVEGEGEVDLGDLVRWALRMSPDRVIVGEVRGDEILPMLNAMSQGNDGSMCTIHSNSSQGAFSKLGAYAIQSSERLPLEATNLLVANAIDFIVFLDQDPTGSKRYVSSIREITGADGHLVVSNEVFTPGPDGVGVASAPLTQTSRDALSRVGFDCRQLETRAWAS